VYLNLIFKYQIVEILVQINSFESQIKKRVTDFKLNVNELDTSIKEVSKEILSDFEFKNNEKYNNIDMYSVYMLLIIQIIVNVFQIFSYRVAMKQNISKYIMNPEISFFNMYKEVRKMIDSLKQTNIFKPLNLFTHSK